jgi:hypothetical protein
MRPQLSGFGTLAVAALVLALGSPAALDAQRARGAGGSGDDGGGRSGGGDRGVAVPRGGDAGPRGGDAGPRGGSVAPRGGDTAPRGGDQGGGRVSAGGTSSPRTTAETQDTTGDRAVPRRPREDRTVVGRAMPRDDVRPSGNRTVIVGSGRYYGGYYPWGYGGLGLGGYYGFYDPWYDPFYYGGGYYGGYYGNYYGRGYSGYEGHLRLKVKPSDAEVFVDGYYAGVVDEFDNAFQHLNIETGPHRIEIREDGYEPLSFEVRIFPGRTVTYKGELKRVP